MSNIKNTTTPKIQKLDEVVVNRIAAGEVIQRPANAIKEMIENSLDARSKTIQVVVKDGGLKLLQIQDDGCGIRKEDMRIVCERFTTSKLSSFDDLKAISTYGFRGEALASISHVAHLTITTKTEESPCAFKAKYEDGKMVPLQPGGKAEAKACAGNKGTQITVEDLFYNVSVRRKALRNTSEEHAKIADVISKYAIHNPSVGFSLKKLGQNLADVRTPSKSTVIDNIKAIHGPTIAKELLEVTHEDEQYAFKLHGYVSNANYSIKKCTLLLFINHRLVESTALRKALDAVYVNYLPKDKHPFMYMSLELNPLNIDVNVHPTKHEVKFLYEDSIIEAIQKVVETTLLGSNESRQYYTQSLIPKMLSAAAECPVGDIMNNNNNNNNSTTNPDEEKKKLYAHQMVRTDAREQKLEAFFPYQSKSLSSTVDKHRSSSETMGRVNSETPVEEDTTSLVVETAERTQGSNENINVSKDGELNTSSLPTIDIIQGFCRSDTTSNETSAHNQNTVLNNASISGKGVEGGDDSSPPKGAKEDSLINVEIAVAGEEIVQSEKHAPKIDLTEKRIGLKSSLLQAPRTINQTTTKSSSSLVQQREIKLTSVRNLRRLIEEKEHLGVKSILEEHKFVGCVNRALSLMQHLTQLYLVNIQRVSQELFYQIIIYKFGNFGYLELSEPAPVAELVRMVLDTEESGWEPEDGDKDELARYTSEFLASKADMLLDYFSVEINENGELTALPILLDNYVPDWNKLPILLLRLASEVDWENEQQCFHDFAFELSHFYSTGEESFASKDDEQHSSVDDTSGDSEEQKEWYHKIEHVLFPAFRTYLFPPKRFSTDGTFLEVANLPDLYKVFERC